MIKKYEKILTSRWALDCLVEGCYIRLEDEEPDEHPIGGIGYFLNITKKIKPVAQMIVNEHNKAIGEKNE